MPSLKVKFPDGKEHEVPAYEQKFPTFVGGEGHAVPGADVVILKPEPLRGYVFMQDGEGNWSAVSVAVTT